MELNFGFINSVLCSVLGLFVLLATLYDYFLCDDQSKLRNVKLKLHLLPYITFVYLVEKLPRLVKIFSARVNSGGLFRISTNNSNPNVIDCLHGLRCMSLIWVIYGHEYIVALKSPNLNRMEMYTVSL